MIKIYVQANPFIILCQKPHYPYRYCESYHIHCIHYGISCKWTWNYARDVITYLKCHQYCTIDMFILCYLPSPIINVNTFHICCSTQEIHISLFTRVNSYQYWTGQKPIVWIVSTFKRFWRYIYVSNDIFWCWMQAICSASKLWCVSLIYQREITDLFPKEYSIYHLK